MGSAMVRIPSMVNIQYIDDPGGFLDAVPNAVLASACPPLSLERLAQRASDAKRVLG
jgi:hypothetical protein